MENLPTAKEVLERRKKYIQKGVNYFPTKSYQENFAKRMLQDFSALKADFVDRIEADRKFWLEKMVLEDALRAKGLAEPLAGLQYNVLGAEGGLSGLGDCDGDGDDNDRDGAADETKVDNDREEDELVVFRVEVGKSEAGNAKQSSSLVLNERLFADARQLVEFGLPEEFRAEDLERASEEEQARKRAASRFKLWRSSTPLSTRPMSGRCCRVVARVRVAQCCAMHRNATQRCETTPHHTKPHRVFPTHKTPPFTVQSLSIHRRKPSKAELERGRKIRVTKRVDDNLPPVRRDSRPATVGEVSFVHEETSERQVRSAGEMKTSGLSRVTPQLFQPVGTAFTRAKPDASLKIGGGSTALRRSQVHQYLQRIFEKVYFEKMAYAAAAEQQQEEEEEAAEEEGDWDIEAVEERYGNSEEDSRVNMERRPYSQQRITASQLEIGRCEDNDEAQDAEEDEQRHRQEGVIDDPESIFLEGEPLVPRGKGTDKLETAPAGEEHPSAEQGSFVHQDTKTSDELVKEYRLEYDRPLGKSPSKGVGAEGRGQNLGEENIANGYATGDSESIDGSVVAAPAILRQKRVQSSESQGQNVKLQVRGEEEGGKEGQGEEERGPMQIVGGKMTLEAKRAVHGPEESSLLSGGGFEDGSVAFSKKQEIWERFAKRDLSAPMKAAYAVLYPSLYGQDKPENSELLKYMQMRQEQEGNRGSVKIMKARPMPKVLSADELIPAIESEFEESPRKHRAATAIQCRWRIRQARNEVHDRAQARALARTRAERERERKREREREREMAMWEREAAERARIEREQRLSATKIQSRWRGKKARDSMDERRRRAGRREPAPPQKKEPRKKERQAKKNEAEEEEEEEEEEEKHREESKKRGIELLSDLESKIDNTMSVSVDIGSKGQTDQGTAFGEIKHLARSRSQGREAREMVETPKNDAKKGGNSPSRKKLPAKTLTGKTFEEKPRSVSPLGDLVPRDDAEAGIVALVRPHHALRYDEIKPPIRVLYGDEGGGGVADRGEDGGKDEDIAVGASPVQPENPIPMEAVVEVEDEDKGNDKTKEAKGHGHYEEGDPATAFLGSDGNEDRGLGGSGYASYVVQVAPGEERYGPFFFWAEVRCRDAGSNSVYVSMDGERFPSRHTLWHLPLTDAGWTWCRFEKAYPLEPGEHDLVVAHRENEVYFRMLWIGPEHQSPPDLSASAIEAKGAEAHALHEEKAKMRASQKEMRMRHVRLLSEGTTESDVDGLKENEEEEKILGLSGAMAEEGFAFTLVVQGTVFEESDEAFKDDRGPGLVDEDGRDSIVGDGLGSRGGYQGGEEETREETGAESEGKGEEKKASASEDERAEDGKEEGKRTKNAAPAITPTDGAATRAGDAFTDADAGADADARDNDDNNSHGNGNSNSNDNAVVQTDTADRDTRTGTLRSVTTAPAGSLKRETKRKSHKRNSGSGLKNRKAAAKLLRKNTALHMNSPSKKGFKKFRIDPSRERALRSDILRYRGHFAQRRKNQTKTPAPLQHYDAQGKGGKDLRADADVFADEEDEEEEEEEADNELEAIFGQGQNTISQKDIEVAGAKLLRDALEGKFLDLNPNSEDGQSVNSNYTAKRRNKLMKDIELGHRIDKLLLAKNLYQSEANAASRAESPTSAARMGLGRSGKEKRRMKW